MYHHHITRAIAQAHVADMQRTAARTRPTAAVPPRHRRHAIVAALIAICALVPTPGALAQPAHDVGGATTKHATAVARDHDLAEPPWARALHIRSEGMNRLYGLGDAAGSPQPATAVACNHHPRATPGKITFTNPLGRSRGPGAGAGLL
jgi:hypothetical protein